MLLVILIVLKKCLSYKICLNMKKNIFYFNSSFCPVVLHGLFASTESTVPIIWFLGAK